MARQYKTYDEEFKKTVVNLYESGKGISELSREYGIGKSTIDSWIKKYKTITTSTGEVTNNDEILKLQRKNRELEQEVEILKKAVAIFSKKQKIKSDSQMTTKESMMLDYYVSVQNYTTQFITIIVTIQLIPIRNPIENQMYKLQEYLMNPKEDMVQLK